jgi:hypothetical protein
MLKTYVCKSVQQITKQTDKQQNKRRFALLEKLAELLFYNHVNGQNHKGRKPQ